MICVTTISRPPIHVAPVIRIPIPVDAVIRLPIRARRRRRRYLIFMTLNGAARRTLRRTPPETEKADDIDIADDTGKTNDIGEERQIPAQIVTCVSRGTEVKKDWPFGKKNKILDFFTRDAWNGVCCHVSLVWLFKATEQKSGICKRTVNLLIRPRKCFRFLFCLTHSLRWRRQTDLSNACQSHLVILSCTKTGTW